jgi:hypothetical protein
MMIITKSVARPASKSIITGIDLMGGSLKLKGVHTMLVLSLVFNKNIEISPAFHLQMDWQWSLPCFALALGMGTWEKSTN